MTGGNAPLSSYSLSSEISIPRHRCISRIREKASESRMLLLWSATALVRRSKAKTDAAAFFVGRLLPSIRAQWRYGASKLAPTKAEPRFRTPQKGRPRVQPSRDFGGCTPARVLQNGFPDESWGFPRPLARQRPRRGCTHFCVVPSPQTVGPRTRGEKSLSSR
jgi:hypothetical protein